MVGELRVRVPATSANLGPGFDCLGVALPLIAEFECHPARSWSVTIPGSDREQRIPTGADNLFVVAALAVAKAAHARLPAQRVIQRSAIPIGKGLGSSAAAIVGGAVAANALLGSPLDRRALLWVATEVEGHADNVAAALYGSVTLALPAEDGPIVTRIPFPSTWRICIQVPRDATQPTRKARAILPRQVPRADAIFNLAHASALVVAILRGDGPLLSLAMHDRLHEPARLGLIPAFARTVAAARAAGAFGAALSGAGPSILAVTSARSASRVVAAMEEAAAAAGAPGGGHALRVRAAGARILR